MSKNKNTNENINNAAAALVAALQGAQSQNLDVAAVEKIAGDVMARKFAAIAPALVEKCTAAAVQAANGGGVRVKVEPVAGPEIDLGVQHKSLPVLLQVLRARDGSDGFAPNVYLYGPAGCGKSTAARVVAQALGLPFFATGALYSKYDLLGLVNAAGDYVPSDFYNCYKNGGVFLFDELDISDARAVKCFAQALANGHMSFPSGKNGEGGVVARHKDCIIIAGGNTDMRGGGASAGFGTGTKQDSAIRDRFIYLHWAADENLEMSLASVYGDMGRDWCGVVQACRARAAAVGIKDFEITPRATLNGCALLAAGVEYKAVIDMCLRKGLNDSAWAKVSRD